MWQKTSGQSTRWNSAWTVGNFFSPKGSSSIGQTSCLLPLPWVTYSEAEQIEFNELIWREISLFPPLLTHWFYTHIVRHYFCFFHFTGLTEIWYLKISHDWYKFAGKKNLKEVNVLCYTKIFTSLSQEKISLLLLKNPVNRRHSLLNRLLFPKFSILWLTSQGKGSYHFHHFSDGRSSVYKSVAFLCKTQQWKYSGFVAIWSGAYPAKHWECQAFNVIISLNQSCLHGLNSDGAWSPFLGKKKIKMVTL